MNQEQVSIQAKDGVCKSWIITPEGKGAWPGVILYMDAFGIRPAMIEMASHIAKPGLAIYRHGF